MCTVLSSLARTRRYYLWMLREVADALSKLEQFFPAYKTSIGSYELAGLVWHQGWNDACRAG